MSPVPMVTHQSTDRSSTPSNKLTVDLGEPMPQTRDKRSGLCGQFFGCFKPLFYMVKRFRGSIRSLRERNSANDGWEISVDRINKNFLLIGVGIEGTVFHSKFNGQDIACKRVKTKEETNIKHLQNLNHINVIKFRGISIASPRYYILMEYCACGSLYDVLKHRRENSTQTKVTQVLDWSRQVANGVDYLHSNQIIHRDLKSPNILFFDRHTLKISDFGTSKPCVDRRGQLMPLNGTAAWLAPEVIRNELCSEKIDVWSFGVVVWEILTCKVPYNNMNPSAVIWGVGKGTLTLLIPLFAPEGLKSLMNLCWNQHPLDRPSFDQIIEHLNTYEQDIALFEQEQEHNESTRTRSSVITEHLTILPTIDLCSHERMKTKQVNIRRSRASSVTTEQINRGWTRSRSLPSTFNNGRQRRRTSSSSRQESSTEDLSTSVTSHRMKPMILSSSESEISTPSSSSSLSNENASNQNFA